MRLMKPKVPVRVKECKGRNPNYRTVRRQYTADKLIVIDVYSDDYVRYMRSANVRVEMFRALYANKAFKIQFGNFALTATQAEGLGI